MISEINIQQQKKELLSLRERIHELELAEHNYQRLAHDLKVLKKEFKLFLSICRLLDEPGATVHGLCKKLADLLPACWPYSEVINVRLTVARKQFKSKNYRRPKWKLPCNVLVKGEEVGLLELGFGEHNPDELPYLNEKMSFVSAVAEKLGRTIEHRWVEEMLRKSEEHFRTLAESNSEAIWVMDTDTIYTYLNQKVKDMVGFEPEEIVGKSFIDFIPPEHRRKYRAILKKIVESQKPFERLENQCICKNGRVIILESSGVPFFDNDGKLIGYRGIDRDITVRKEAEEALRESEEFSTNLLKNIPNPMLVVNPDTTIRYVNPALEQLTGFPSSELIGKKAPYPWWPQNGLAQAYNGFGSIMQRGSRDQEQLFVKAGGEKFWVEITSLPVKTGDTLRYYLESWIDTTERKRLRENMQFYIAATARAQEDERKRIAHELHDETTQSLFNLITDVEKIIKGKSKQQNETIEELKNLQVDIKNIMGGVRRLSHEIRPGLLDHLGLVPSIEALIEEADKTKHTRYQFETTGVIRRLSPEVELEVFRIVQEALRNIKKHSHASEVKINLKFTKDKVRLNISDNGNGFELPEVLSSFARKGKLGLLGMYERTHLINGIFSLDSQRGKGTTISIEVLNMIDGLSSSPS